MHHRLVVDATPPCLERVHGLLDAVWAATPAISGAVRTRFALATAELVANVVEHGGAALPEPPRIVFDVESDEGTGSVRGRIVDDGAAPPDDAASGPPGGDPDPFGAVAADADDGPLDLDDVTSTRWPSPAGGSPPSAPPRTSSRTSGSPGATSGSTSSGRAERVAGPTPYAPSSPRSRRPSSSRSPSSSTSSRSRRTRRVR